MRKTLVMGAVVAVATLAPTTVHAHECINASRSERGQQASAGSDMWFLITAEDIAGFIAGELGIEVTPELMEAYLAALIDAGLATSFSVFGHHTIGFDPHGEDPVAAFADGTKSGDGRGIDHLEAVAPAYVDVMLAVVNG